MAEGKQIQTVGVNQMTVYKKEQLEALLEEFSQLEKQKEILRSILRKIIEDLKDQLESKDLLVCIQPHCFPLFCFSVFSNSRSGENSIEVTSKDLKKFKFENKGGFYSNDEVNFVAKQFSDFFKEK